MFLEFNPTLTSHCESATQEIFNSILNRLINHFSEDRLQAVAQALTGPDAPKAPIGHPLYQESLNIIQEYVQGLSSAEVFTIRCFTYDIAERDSDANSIAQDAMEHWLTYLYDRL